MNLYMYFVISHYTENKGLTDYYIEYLRGHHKSYYYLRHPLNTCSGLFSELYYFDGLNNFKVKEYRCANFFICEMARTFVLNIAIVCFYGLKSKKIFCFGGFNVVPVLFLRLLNKKIYFWGADYSRKRFKNFILNKIYLFLETLSCTLSNVTVSVSRRQEEARIKYHFLSKKKSIVISNGIKSIQLIENNDSFGGNYSFVYMGSITHQHGIVDFIRYMYFNDGCMTPLYIFGGGECEDELKRVIEELKLEGIVQFLGRKSYDEIFIFLSGVQGKVFGIAPYVDTINDHVYYGDSLKIKEYLSYGIPFVTSSIAYVPEDLKDFGLKYSNLDEVTMDKLMSIRYTKEKLVQGLKGYYWDNLFDLIDGDANIR